MALLAIGTLLLAVLAAWLINRLINFSKILSTLG